MKETIMVLGGAGYIGWPLSLHLASINDGNVIIVDNLIKNKIINEEQDNSLLPTEDMTSRIATSKKDNLIFEQKNIANEDILSMLFEKYKPTVIINYAQLPSAPFSLKDEHSACFVTHNNTIGNLRLLWAMKKYCPDAHLIKMSTMGIYGQPDFDIPEDKLKVEIDGKKHLINYPYMAGSFYHWSKVFETQHCDWISNLWKLKITDLAQGIVYGTSTAETRKDEKLCTSFYYSGTWGTVINRFVTQALMCHPLTVYGSGEQRRGLINLNDAIKCVELYINNPPNKGEYRRFNQLCEQHYSINEMAQLVNEVAKEEGCETRIENIENPRVENEHHYYKVDNKKIKDLGLKAHDIRKEIKQMFKDLFPFNHRVKHEVMEPKIKWTEVERK